MLKVWFDKVTRSNSMFYGRKRELNILNELLERKIAALVVIKGRRRIGKSRLIQEFCSKFRALRFTGLPPEEKISAQEQRLEFNRQFQQQTGVVGVKDDDWGHLFWHMAQYTTKGRWIIILDEINWMGSGDPTFLGKLKTIWDENLKLNPKLILILSGSMTTWINKNIISSTGFFGRISIDLTLDELMLHECNYFWGEYSERITAYEKFKILSITGGVPRYLEEINPKITAEENIQRLCFRKEGLLFNEFDRIFTDLFGKKSKSYKKIIEELSNGPKSSEQILKAIKMPKGGTASDYFSDLVQTGYIAKDSTWSIKSGKELKLNKYRLKDNYLRFYLKYLALNKNKIEQQKLTTLPNLDSIMGLQFENLVVNQAANLHQLLNIRPEQILYDNPYFQKETLRHKACQIDYLIQTQYKNLYLCEIKFQRNPIGVDIIQEINQKKQRLNTGKHASLRFVLIHVNGVTDALQDADFFSHIIDFGQLLNEK